jgi:hypothetical protein
MATPGVSSVRPEACEPVMCSEKLYSKKDAAKWLLAHHPDKGGEPTDVDIGAVASCMGKKTFCQESQSKKKETMAETALKNSTRKANSGEMRSLNRVFQKAYVAPVSRGPKTIINPYKANSRQLQCVRNVSNWSKISPDNRFNKRQFSVSETDKLIPIASPKLEAMLQNIEALDANDMVVFGKKFKHFIFSDIKLLGYGAKIISAGLIARKWTSILKQEVRKTRKGNNKTYIVVDVPKNSNGRNFAVLSSTPLWNAPFGQALKKEVLSVYNKRPDNIYGEDCRLIVLDSGFKEGIDLFDVRYVHLFEPLMTAADMTQALGRATRLCGQKGLDFIPKQGWPLHVFKYSQSIPENLQPLYKAQNLFEIMLQMKGLDTRLHRITKSIQDVSIMAAVDQPLTDEIHKSGLLPKMEVRRTSSKSGEVSMVLIQDVSNMSNHLSRANLMNSKAKTMLLLKDAESSTNKSRNSSGAESRNSSGAESRNSSEAESRNSNEAESITDLESDPCGPRDPVKCDQASIVAFAPSRMSSLKVIPSVVVESNKLIVRVPTVPLVESKGRPTSWFELRRYVTDKFSKMAWGKQEVVNKCGGGKKNSSTKNKTVPSAAAKTKKAAGKKGLPALKLIDYTPTQDFISSYFTVNSPLKGMLLWHSVGTGKTCTGIALASRQFEPAGYSVIWVTRHTLKADIWKNIFEQVCHKTVSDEVRAGRLTPADVEKRQKKMFQQWIPPMSYRQFSNLVTKKNPLYKVLEARNGKADPLAKTLIIIDEAHKLYSSDFKGAEKPDVGAFMDALQNSYAKSGKNSARVVLMTATPYNQSPMELMSLLNLCREKKNALPETIPEFINKYMDETGNFSKDGIQTYMNDIAGQISYLNREADPSQFAQPIFADIVLPISTYDMVGNNSEEHEILRKKAVELEAELAELNEKTIPYLESQIQTIQPAYDSHLRECVEKFTTNKEIKSCQKRVDTEYKAALKLENRNLKTAKKRSEAIKKEQGKFEQKSRRISAKMRKSGPASFTQQAQLEMKCKLGEPEKNNH